MRKVDFHLHDGCEIYFLITGSVKYFVEKNIYPINFGDLMITNNHEIHKPSISADSIYERITIEFNPALAQLFNTADFDLLNCFYNRQNGEQNRLSLNHKETSEILILFNKYETLCKNPVNCSEILKLNYFIELLVFINQLFMNSKHIESGTHIHKKLIPVLEYIEQNLESDLSLENIEKRFYINRYYLSKLFKKWAGSTIHEYIIYKRISTAKKLIHEGYSITEASIKSGFNDYSAFLKMFKKTVGILPKEYSKHFGKA